MAEIDKTLNTAPTGVEEEITTEEVTTPMEIEVEGEEETVGIGPSTTDNEQFATNIDQIGLIFRFV